jgi:hypothetical protein
MVHYGKHIIDRETGLCEICDRGVIHDLRKGKRPGRKYLYSNRDGKFTYRPDDNQTHINEEPRPRYVRKPLYPEPPPPRTRRVVYEEPAVVRKRVVRRTYTPPDDVQDAPLSRPTTLYYVDTTGQMVPQNEALQDSPRRRYVVQNNYTPPRTARVVRQRAQTPPPRTTRVIQQRSQTPPPRTTRVIQERSQTPPARVRRQYNSDPDVIQRPYVVQSDDSYNYEAPIKPSMYYLEGKPNNNLYTTINPVAQRSRDDNTPPPPLKVIYQEDAPRKQRQLEPIEPKHYVEPPVTVVKRVYKKLPAGRNQAPEEEYIPNGNSVRNGEKTYPSPRQYASSPQPFNRSIPQTNPSIYYIQSTNAY